MAINQSRSLNEELHQGMASGRYRLLHPNRAGEVEPTFLAGRRGLSPYFYGDILQEEPAKNLPDASGSC